MQFGQTRRESNHTTILAQLMHCLEIYFSFSMRCAEVPIVSFLSDIYIRKTTALRIAVQTSICQNDVDCPQAQ